jgi:hypothetical protein
MSDPVARLNAALEDRYRIVREIGKGPAEVTAALHHVRGARYYRDVCTPAPELQP